MKTNIKAYTDGLSDAILGLQKNISKRFNQLDRIYYPERIKNYTINYLVGYKNGKIELALRNN